MQTAIHFEGDWHICVSDHGKLKKKSLSLMEDPE